MFVCVECLSDYRTEVSGVKPVHLAQGVSFKSCQEEFVKITEGRIIVGHALAHDFEVQLLIIVNAALCCCWFNV